MKLTKKQKQIVAEFESNFEYEDLNDIQSLIYGLEDGEAIAKIYDLEERDEDQDEPSDYENEVQEKTEFLHTYYQNKLRKSKLPKYYIHPTLGRITKTFAQEEVMNILLSKTVITKGIDNLASSTKKTLKDWVRIYNYFLTGKF